MKKLLSIVMLWLLLGGAIMAIGQQIPLTVGYDEPYPGIPGHGKGPEYVPSVIQDDYTITFLAFHPAYLIKIMANGIVVYSVGVSQYTTSVVLPSWLSGQYEIRFCPDDYYYLYGYIEL